MEINISNFNAIGNASVKLNGLTVIAGENDTGKSTVGKLIFAIVKAMRKYEHDFEIQKEKRVEKEVEKFYRLVRGFLLNYKGEARNWLRKEFFPKEFLIELERYISGIEKKADSLMSIISHKHNIIEEYIDASVEKKLFLHESIDKIKDIIIEEEDVSALVSRALVEAIYSEFYGNIKSFDSTISVNDDNLELIKFKVQNAKVFGITLTDEYIDFDDTTFVESSIYLQLNDLVRNADTLLNSQQEKYILDDRSSYYKTIRPKVPLHIKDLMGKLEESKYFSDNFDLFSDSLLLSDVLNDINEVIHGGFNFQSRTKDFVLKRGADRIKSVNVASGIKSFGILQLLIQSGAINERSLLIVDEPETNLHPKWQVEYAKMICKLVKADIPVLITSHSPYMIQALNHFSKEFGVEEKTNFYLAEKNDSGKSDIKDVTNDLNQIFQTLSQPLTELV
ncbi:MAG: putative ATP-dependent endonuclease of OLD family, partial [Flammeovirgaceae bacterium]|jgi:predicted ATP-dependent endonuclease of OLD family